LTRTHAKILTDDKRQLITHQPTSGKFRSALRLRSSIQFVNHCLRSSIFFLLNAYDDTPMKQL